MLMDLADLVRKHDLTITGVLHVGAHLAEEAPTYETLGIRNVTWIEANPAVLGKLRRILARHGHPLIHALVYSEDGEVIPFNVTNYDGMSSSIFEFGTHPQFSPDTIFTERIHLPTRTIDSLVVEHGINANFLNMDLQGAELHALRGATCFLDNVDAVMCEVNQAEVYIGCAKVWELDSFLASYGFDRVETHWVPGQGWGDALYMRR